MDTTAESQKQTKLDAFLLKRDSVNASHGAKSLGGGNHGPNRVESLEKSEQIRVMQNGLAANEESDFKPPEEPLESANSNLQSTNTISDASGENNAIEIGSVSPEPCQSPPLKRKFDTRIASENEATHTIPEAGALEKSDTKRLKPQALNDKNIEITPTPAENKAETEENSVSHKFTSAATETPLLASEPESATPTSDHSQPEKLTKRQEERLAKQKLREVERLERERKKEEERMQRQEEREKKELERKQKREALEKEK
ncbi:hypothetical protein OXX69_003732, partial [Metschnikowia pulcherrima]